MAKWQTEYGRTFDTGFKQGSDIVSTIYSDRQKEEERKKKERQAIFYQAMDMVTKGIITMPEADQWVRTGKMPTTRVTGQEPTGEIAQGQYPKPIGPAQVNPSQDQSIQTQPLPSYLKDNGTAGITSPLDIMPQIYQGIPSQVPVMRDVETPISKPKGIGTYWKMNKEGQPEDTGLPTGTEKNQIIQEKSTGLLPPDVEAQKIRIAEASGMGRAVGYGKIRPISVYDTKTGDIKTINMNEFNEANKSEPNRYIEEAKASPILKSNLIMNDMSGSIQRTRESLNNLKNDFDSNQNAQFALIMKADDPHSAWEAFKRSAFGKTLTSDQIDYVTDLIQLREQMLGLRNTIGAGQGSDMMREAMNATLPSSSTPSKEFANSQLDKADATLERIKPYIPKIHVPKSKKETPSKSGNESDPLGIR